MNWTETRDVLIALGIPAARLPEAWAWRINLRDANLRGADLSNADLRDADLRGANLSNAYLRDANLRDANLRGANLRGADLTGAALRGADLTGANLRGADLYGANLTGANLSEAYLTGAYLRGANLTGANLSGAAINWQSHDLIAEILRRAAGQDVQRRMLVGLILISRDWCWEKFLALELDPPDFEWALAELRQRVKDGDDAPEALRAAPETDLRVMSQTAGRRGD